MTEREITMLLTAEEAALARVVTIDNPHLDPNFRAQKLGELIHSVASRVAQQAVVNYRMQRQELARQNAKNNESR